MAAGCATTAPDADGHVVISDPFEGMNRFFFDLNQRLDRNAGRPPPTPIAKPFPERCVSACTIVLDNLGSPVTVANEPVAGPLGKRRHRGRTFPGQHHACGVAGIFDVATDWGMPGRNRDFGETMGTYGVPPGPYLVLPFRGSTDVRDFAGNYIDGYVSPLRYVRYEGRNYVGLMKSTLGSMDNRANQSRHLPRYRARQRGLLRHHADPAIMERRARLIEGSPVRTAGITGLLRTGQKCSNPAHDGRRTHRRLLLPLASGRDCDLPTCWREAPAGTPSRISP